MAEKGILDGLNYFSRIGEEELDQIIENGTELWNIRDVAAYMEVSLENSKEIYQSEGKLKPEKISKSGEKLFSNLDVMELYREKKDVNQYVVRRKIKRLFYTFIEEHPECIPIFKKAIDGLLQ